jgi:hypothetical protein
MALSLGYGVGYAHGFRGSESVLIAARHSLTVPRARESAAADPAANKKHALPKARSGERPAPRGMAGFVRALEWVGPRSSNAPRAREGANDPSDTRSALAGKGTAGRHRGGQGTGPQGIANSARGGSAPRLTHSTRSRERDSQCPGITS